MRIQRLTLAVLVAADQLRVDYLDRFSTPLNGGLARFRTHAERTVIRELTSKRASAESPR
jgi:hypothetical protein